MKVRRQRILFIDNGLPYSGRLKSIVAAVAPEAEFSQISSVTGGLQTVERSRPQVVLLDADLLSTEGAELVEAIREAHADSCILVLAADAAVAGAARRLPGIDECLLMNDGSGPMLAITLRQLLLRGQLMRELSVSRRSLRKAQSRLQSLESDGRDAPQNGIGQTTAKRIDLDSRLGQAQKMEALGQLTGGLAHDFNNLLAVIIGNLQLIQRSVHGEARLEKQVQSALDAAARGAKLTRQMLTVARRQPLEPQAVTVTELLNDFAEILYRTLGGAVSVRIHPAPDCWPVMADPSLLESAILNLAINARDAMPDGGELRIEIDNLTIQDKDRDFYPELGAGDYVRISVTDQGVGIPAEVLARVTEPFFTTKAPGSGTGLGLSMVHGFATQSGGHFELQSKTGEGTTATIYLPRATAVDIELTVATQARLRAIPKGEERILLVEDDENVRDMARSMLEGLGYSVEQVPNADEALAALGGGTTFDLVFTDIVMPGRINGIELGRQVRECYPGTRVLHTSGHIGGRSGAASDANVQPFLGKPYRIDALASKVREVLDSRLQGDSARVPSATAVPHAN